MVSRAMRNPLKNICVTMKAGRMAFAASMLGARVACEKGEEGAAQTRLKLVKDEIYCYQQADKKGVGRRASMTKIKQERARWEMGRPAHYSPLGIRT
jgi:hypothetical protein